MKKLIVFLMLAFAASGCGVLRSDNYYTKQGKKWNDYTNGVMKCKNNANPSKPFKD